jgi:hypothetical protein
MQHWYREGDRERQVERVMTSYEDGSLLIDRLAAGMVVDQDCAKSCQTVLPIPAPTATRHAPPLLDYYRLLICCTLSGRLVDLNKFANSAIALCAS